MRYLKLFLLLIIPVWGIAALHKPVFKQDDTVFEKLDLNYPGMEKVKILVHQQQYEQAAEALLEYYRGRTHIRHPEYNREDQAGYYGKKLPADVLEKADKGSDHRFFVHKGYGFLDYGKDINWQYWPVRDNEIRWQVNRMYWWPPMGLAYWATGNETYAKEWVFQYRDWIKKNPQGLSDENDRFAWRPLETSRRLQDQTALFNMFIGSPNFTAQFLMEFLENYHHHAQHVLHHYSEKGNHLLFEAQRMIYAGAFFPEFKKAQEWRKSGIDILNREIKKQVYADGLQYELSPNYHAGTINIFLRALRMAQLARLEKEFPESYKKTVESMIMALVNFSFPDYSYPMFSDAKLEQKSGMIKKFRSWAEAFPENPVIRYFATDGKKGTPPSYESHALKQGGFYTFRNSWKDTATVMVLKASPPAFWHSQPDNGTFDLWVKGRNFMPDAGAYVYGGDEEVMKLRNWYRQTRMHKTLTLNNADMDICDARLRIWKTSDSLDILSYTNPSYQNLDHTRTVLFIDKKYFIIFDKAEGPARGKVAVHFQLKEGKALISKKGRSAQTAYKDGNNLLIKNLNPDRTEIIREEGKVSYAYRREIKRPAFAFNQDKKDPGAVRFITVLYPFEGKKAPRVDITENENNDPEHGVIDITLNINGKIHWVKKNFN
ncbi:heparin-sulfate lyase HepC [Sinomicrobium weinanense]|uniref:Heparinase II/III family protein n=1 Tax=Sinomicrobium weinanense TaxID=2842200 RepID=A0A926JUF3_9FLAO|nr:heparin-sulfate lyase HepC [Sinomicrobium weinanense]MBC9797745.1 heparinase II/III family protein [Sinomicrobium weinanense]MBU3125990.1 heparinase II/III family protein [Sinomicrobium weinanense]